MFNNEIDVVSATQKRQATESGKEKWNIPRILSIGVMDRNKRITA